MSPEGRHGSLARLLQDAPPDDWEGGWIWCNLSGVPRRPEAIRGMKGAVEALSDIMYYATAAVGGCIAALGGLKVPCALPLSGIFCCSCLSWNSS